MPSALCCSPEAKSMYAEPPDYKWGKGKTKSLCPVYLALPQPSGRIPHTMGNYREPNSTSPEWMQVSRDSCLLQVSLFPQGVISTIKWTEGLTPQSSSVFECRHRSTVLTESLINCVYISYIVFILTSCSLHGIQGEAIILNYMSHPCFNGLLGGYHTHSGLSSLVYHPPCDHCLANFKSARQHSICETQFDNQLLLVFWLPPHFLPSPYYTPFMRMPVFSLSWNTDLFREIMHIYVC